MIRGELQRLLAMVPFEPFVIKLSNGAAFEIHDPQMIALHPRTAHIANQDQSWVIIQYVMICSVDLS